MLKQFADIINSSTVDVKGDSILLTNYKINDLSYLNSLDEKQCVNSFSKNGNIVYYEDLNAGDIIDIDLSLLYLIPIGYYDQFDIFIKKNKYTFPNNDYYIRDINCFNNDANISIESYSNVVLLINTLKKISKHNYTEADIDFSLLYVENNALLLPFIYDVTDIHQISETNVLKLVGIVDAFDNDNSKEKWIYINELIDFLFGQPENNRFKYLLSHICEFADRAANAYQYYIRNFSYNKLKTELDSAALDYATKVQSVINDAQTKLIAIPTAFVLAVANINFEKVIDNKNIGIISSLYVFSWLIDLFIKNQKSALKFIQSNVSQYKSSFSPQQNEIISSSFTIVDYEIKKQKNRLNAVLLITWGLPIILTIALAIIYS